MDTKLLLSDIVKIDKRFKKSIQVEEDLYDSSSLKGFICTPTLQNSLLSMARQISETSQCAFTWTGPYGSGKSSLAIAFLSLLNGDSVQRKYAKKLIGPDIAENICSALDSTSKPWAVVPITGSRANPVEIIGKGLEKYCKGLVKENISWTDSRLLDELKKISSGENNIVGGAVIFVDEMGKFLEAAAYDNADIYIFQQIAELAARSNNRLLIIGVLHQAFEEYSYRLSREMRDEWSKIHGRFADIAINYSGTEHVELLSQAIKSNYKFTKPSENSLIVAQTLYSLHVSHINEIANGLENCWPLHPIVTILLGSISKRRFGQNQRSIFGFLNSSEPFGFQDFVKSHSDDYIYTPEMLWEYLRVNLEPSILASPDGHRWSMAIEVVERFESSNTSSTELKMLKTIALIDVFRDRSGLLPTQELLNTIFHSKDQSILEALENLITKKCIVYKTFKNAYAIFAGSDFDIESAIKANLYRAESVDFSMLNSLASLHPILAKRSYHKTGAMRWFDVEILPINELEQRLKNYSPKSGEVGQFILTFQECMDEEEIIRKSGFDLKDKNDSWFSVIGLAQNSKTIMSLSRELLTLERIRNDSPELAGDKVARREVKARFTAVKELLEHELQRAFLDAKWFNGDEEIEGIDQQMFTAIASEIVDNLYPDQPMIHNELLNRIKPSSNAVGARNALLYRMVLNSGQEFLGIEGYPPEGGLFKSILETTKLYKNTVNGWKFVSPNKTKDEFNIYPMWNAAIKYLEENHNRIVSLNEIYDIWEKPPFGLKAGLMPILAVALVLAERNNVAFYRNGLFQANLSDLDMDYLVRDSSEIQLRWMNLPELSKKLLMGFANIVKTLGCFDDIELFEPIDVARGIVLIFDSLHPWTMRTSLLSKSTIKIRRLLKQANDPNKLVFDDLPFALLGTSHISDDDLVEIISIFEQGILELINAYPQVLNRTKEFILSELGVPNDSPQALKDLRERAINIKQLAGDFRLEAFIGRISNFNGSIKDIEGLISLATNKPSKEWVDQDIDRATIELSSFIKEFVRAETLAHVKGRKNKRRTIALILGIDKTADPLLADIDLLDSDYERVNSVVDELNSVLDSYSETKPDLILAALAEICANKIKSLKRKK